MSIHIFAVTHRHHGLLQVADASQHAEALARACQQICQPDSSESAAQQGGGQGARQGAKQSTAAPDATAHGGTVHGGTAQGDAWVILATCNRFEVLADVHPSRAEALRQAILAELPQALVLCGDEAVEHIFQVACGLDSLVVGEREIVAQIRRAMEVSAGHLHGRLSRLLDAALSASRVVAHIPGLQRSCLSLVDTALELAREHMGGDGSRVLLVGTGAYAGKVVQALRRRGCPQIGVYSPSGRAEEFASRHGIEAVGAQLVEGDSGDGAGGTGGTGGTALDLTDLPQLLADVDLVVCARGRGTIVDRTVVDAIPAAHRPVFIDLALPADVDPALALSPTEGSPVGPIAEPTEGSPVGPTPLRIITMPEVASRLPSSAAAAVEEARALARVEAQKFLAREHERRADHLVVELRDHITSLVDQEIAALPAAELLPREEVERVLRHLAGRLSHGPTTAARKRARSGDLAGIADAVALLIGKDTNG